MVRHADLFAVMDITRRMLEKARCGKWDDLATMEDQRREGLEDFFSRPIHNEQQREIAEQLENILDMNRELTLLAQREKDDIGAKLGDLQTGRRAVTAYASRL